MSRYALLGSLMSMIVLSFASAEAPIPVTNMAYATVDEKTLYIQMGLTPDGSFSTNQFFSLDLTVPNWNTDNPPWKDLVSSTTDLQAPSDFGPSMTVSGDKQSLIVWGGYSSQISTYNIENGLWAPSIDSAPNLTPIRQGFQAVTDPNTGLVYVPSGADQGKAMVAYNPKTNVTQSLPMPAELSGNGLGYYGAVWSTQKNSVFVYGGHLITANSHANTQLFGYDPSTKLWTSIATYGGAKLIVFGGLNSLDSKLSGLYVLDVATMTWSKGMEIDPSQGRTNMACTVAGDNFVAWGGDQFGDIPESLGTPLVYNLKENKWTTQFSLPDGPTVHGTQKFPIASAIGAIVGSLVLVSLIGLLVYRRNRRNKVYIQDIESTASFDSKTTSGKRRPVKSLTINTDIKVPMETTPSEKKNTDDSGFDKASIKRTSSRKSNFKLSGDLEYLAQLSQLEKQMDHELENERPSDRRLSQIRQPRTPSVVSSLSQNSLQHFIDTQAEADNRGLIGK
ncbi:hypothetical protein BGZ76_010356 [Entomortierella beljakovae]|nr:hypothetical protein BGZ76_010356 [Entomortierella beljakovae]